MHEIIRYVCEHRGEGETASKGCRGNSKTMGDIWHIPLWQVVTSSLELLGQIQIGIWPGT